MKKEKETRRIIYKAATGVFAVVATMSIASMNGVDKVSANKNDGNETSISSSVQEKEGLGTDKDYLGIDAVSGDLDLNSVDSFLGASRDKDSEEKSKETESMTEEVDLESETVEEIEVAAKSEPTVEEYIVIEEEVVEEVVEEITEESVEEQILYSVIEFDGNKIPVTDFFSELTEDNVELTQAAIDEGKAIVAYNKLDNSDNSLSYVLGHNPGIMAPLAKYAGEGKSIYVHDIHGNKKEYLLSRITSQPEAGDLNLETMEIVFRGGEVLVFQFCVPGGIEFWRGTPSN